MVNEIEFLEAMQVLELRPDDILVLKSKMVLSHAARGNIVKAFKEHIKIKNQVVILEEGMEIGVLRGAL